MPKNRNYVCLFLNGEEVQIAGSDAFLMLSEWLRKRRGLTGTKIVCAEGDCGACSVFRAFGGKGGDRQLVPVNSCITTVAQVDGCSIVTVEGLALQGEQSPVQKAMTACHGSQCGFCTPGFVVAMTSLFEGPDADKDKSRQRGLNSLTGNLCRCTGYLPIVQAAESVQWDPKFDLAPRWFNKTIQKRLGEVTRTGVELSADEKSFVAPVTLSDALRAMSRKSKIRPRVLAAGTDLGVQSNKGRLGSQTFVSLHLIEELHQMKLHKGRLHVGARVTLEKLRLRCKEVAPEFAGLLNLFASPQIKNVATLIGNVANGSPIGDTLPWLMVSDAVVHTARLVSGRVKRRKIPFTELYKGYREMDLHVGEIITHIDMALPGKRSFTRALKASQRKDLDISAVGAACWMDLQTLSNGTRRIKECRLSFGGVAAIPLRMRSVERMFEGATLPVLSELKDEIHSKLQDEIEPISDVRGTAAWRRWLAASFVDRICAEVGQ